MPKLTLNLFAVVVISLMLGINGCVTTNSGCPEYPIPAKGVPKQIINYCLGDRDILNWLFLPEVADGIPLPIYEKLLQTYKEHPEVCEFMSRQLDLWDKLDERNRN